MVDYILENGSLVNEVPISFCYKIYPHEYNTKGRVQ